MPELADLPVAKGVMRLSRSDIELLTDLRICPVCGEAIPPHQGFWIRLNLLIHLSCWSDLKWIAGSRSGKRVPVRKSIAKLREFRSQHSEGE